MRSLSLVQAAVAFAVGGAILAVAVPTFIENTRASRLAEPIDALGRLATRASALAAGSPIELAYPASVTLTPAEVPAGARVMDPPGTWDHPTWKKLSFTWEVEHSYAFEFESRTEPGAAYFVARALGDLDGDGVNSHFEIEGKIEEGGEPITYPIKMYREVE